MNVLDSFKEKFDLETLTLFENYSWVLSLRPEQLTLGSMLISSSKGICDFQDYKNDDGAKFYYTVAISEKIAKEVFGAVRINILCLMMVDPIVHFHIIPRYDSKKLRYNKIWEDLDWPKPPSFRCAPTEVNVLQEIWKDIKESISYYGFDER